MAGPSLSTALFPARLTLKLFLLVVQAFFMSYALWCAYKIRMYPIKDYGYLIHEFDPWFNYRATEYLKDNGVEKFFKWYDYMSWYPLGRPIGTTIYPGMQLTGVGIWHAMQTVEPFNVTIAPVAKLFNPYLKQLKKLGWPYIVAIPKTLEHSHLSLNNICCLMPPWFGSVATFFTGMLAYECTFSTNVAVFTALVMAIIPAHLMRSVAGEFDNEAIAMAAISSTFWLWLRSIRNARSWPVGVFAGISYAYMVAAWGGFIFVLNMIGLHALMLVGLGRFNLGVYKAYTLLFVIGTVGAIQVPVVGWNPLRSFEQIGPLLVLLGYQVLAFCEWRRQTTKMTTKEFVIFRIKCSILFLLALAGVGALLWPTGYFGPLGARIRGLFVKHTKTGNPLVDSVAEHQPASANTYTSFLNLPLDFAYHAFAVSILHRTNGAYFLYLYAAIAHHFSGKMSRLVLICAPIVAIGCGLFWGWVIDFLLEPFFLFLGKKGYDKYGPVKEEKVDDKDKKSKDDKVDEDEGDEQVDKDSNGTNKKLDKDEKGDKVSKGDDEKVNGKGDDKKVNGKSEVATSKVRKSLDLAEWEEDHPGGIFHIKQAIKNFCYRLIPDSIERGYCTFRRALDGNYFFIILRIALSIGIVYYGATQTTGLKKTKEFVKHADHIAKHISSPQVVYKAQQRDGSSILIDDYLKGYHWIDKNTPKDSRVMAWWDYGYQITGIAKRTSIADGNTWNHEHIATLGRTMTSTQKKAWNAIRHLADYVLVWAGGHGDDLSKSTHLARIGNSVFPDHCGDSDPKCQKFGFYQGGIPTPMMKDSLLFNMVKHGVEQGVQVDKKLFQEVHTTKYGLMRVFEVMNVSQESKRWVADPKNRICDAPGSWYCVGQYPPALHKLIKKRRNFDQLEDFNKARGKSAYTKLIEKELSQEL